MRAIMSFFSIVREVDPGAKCSYRVGRTEVASFTHEESAYSYAEQCQNHHAVAGMKYVVDVLDSEEDPRRCPDEPMRRDAERFGKAKEVDQ